MTNYYLMENGVITHSANWKFDIHCFETEEEIIRDNNQLYLASEYSAMQKTKKYKAKVLGEENIIKKAELQEQIDELDKKSIRAIREPSIKDTKSGQTWLEYYTSQIQDLRTEIASL